MLDDKALYRILTALLIAGVIIGVAFPIFYPKPTVRITRRTRLTLNYYPPKIVPGEKITLTGKLEYHDPWEPLPDRAVSLYYSRAESEEWNLIANVTTDSEGEFKYEWTPDLPPGEYKIKASYRGDGDYMPSETESLTAPGGMLLVIPETQMGIISIMVCMLLALFIKRYGWSTSERIGILKKLRDI